jgi:prepilin-type N-terminal cleavage/methylation domain-containing protein
VKLKKKDGFSLIEMMIVIAVLGIVLAIAAPNFTEYRNRTNLKESARDISSDLLLYKQRSVSENVRYRITFNYAGNSYTVEKQTGMGLATWDTVVTKTIGQGNSAIKIMQEPVFFPTTNSTLEIYSRGTSGAGSIQIRHERLNLKAVVTITSMGRVHVKYETVS